MTVSQIVIYIRQFSNTNIYFLVGLCVFSSVIEMLSVASIAPFLASVSQTTGASLSFVSHLIEPISNLPQHIQIIVFGIACALLFVISGLINSFALYYINKTGYDIGHNMSKALFSKYINANYDYFFEESPANLQRKVAPEVDRIVNGVFIAFITIFQKATTVILLFSVMLLTSVKLALGLMLFGFLAYLIIYFFLSPKFKLLASKVINSNEARVRVSIEALEGIRELKINGLHELFLGRFALASKTFNSSQAVYQILSQVVKYVIEAVGLTVILVYVAFSHFFHQADFLEIIQGIAVVGLAGYRLLPALQSAYTNLTSIQYNRPSFEQINMDLNALNDKKNEKFVSDKVTLMKLSNVTYTYPGKTKPIIKNLSYTFYTGNIYAIVGPSGTGKSSLVDLVSSIISPEFGTIEFFTTGGIKCEFSPKIAYVSQTPHIFDDSILNNITLGEESSDRSRLEIAMNAAQINAKFIQKFEDGLNCKVGDKGIQLSGGDKQRIAIARALYVDADILIFDEATTGLDDWTQAQFMKELIPISKHKIILVVSHDHTVIREANYMIDFGVMVS